MAYIPNSNSVVAFQSQPSSLLSGVSVIGTVPVTQTGTWAVNMPSPSVLSYQAAGSVLAVSGNFTAGNTSVTAFQGGAWTTSVVNITPSSFMVGASIIGVTPVSGTVFVAGSVATVGSVTVLQGTNPWNVNVPTPSYVTYQAAGSVMAVSGNFTSGNTSVTAFQGGAWSTSVTGGYVNVIGSVALGVGNTSVTLAGGNASVSGTVGASIIGIGILNQADGASAQLKLQVDAFPRLFNGTNYDRWRGDSSIGALVSTGASSVISVSQGSVAVAIVSGSIAATFTPPANQSVSGTIQAELLSTNASIITVGGSSGNSSVQLLGSQAVIGSVAVLQGTSPWNVNVPSPSTIAYQLAGSVMAVSGSFSGGNSSITLLGGGTVYQEKDSAGNSSVLGIPFLFKSNNTTSVLATVSTANPLPVSVGGAFTVNDSSSPNGFQFGMGGTLGAPTVIPYVFNGTNYDRLRGNSSVGAFVHVGAGSVITVVQGSVAVAGNLTANISSASVVQQGTWQVSVMNTLPSSLMVGASVFGTVPVTQVTNPWNVNMPSPSVVVIHPAGSVVQVRTDNASVVAVLSNSSVAVLQGTSPWLVTGSIAAIVGNNIGSIVGTYSEDSAHTSTDKGLFTMAVRNDAVSSITSSERDYSPHVVDEVGRTIVKPFAGEIACIISYVGSVVSGSVTLIQASVIGSRSYITDFWVTNTGSVANLITFQGGDTSLIGYTIAPAGGGSNSPGIAIPLRTTLSQDLAWKATGTSSVVYLTVKGYQAP